MNQHQDTFLLEASRHFNWNT